MVDERKFATKCKFWSDTWFNIGKLIYLISKGSNEGYKLWLKYSSYDQQNFDENLCYSLWTGFDEIMPDDFEEFMSDEYVDTEDDEDSEDNEDGELIAIPEE